MRTTITLDADVVERLNALQQERGLSFKDAVNQTLRRGFAGGRGGAHEGRYRMPTRDLRLRAGVDIDRIRDELSNEDDERFLTGEA